MIDFPESEFSELLEKLRANRPLVHVLTNDVVQEITADVLLAAGASPAMVVAPEESGTFAGIADGLLINIGTPTAERIRAMKLAADTANEKQTPWVLDPVAAGGIPWRDDVIRSRRKAPDRHPRECQRNPCARGLFLVRKRSRQLRLIRLGARSRATSRAYRADRRARHGRNGLRDGRRTHGFDLGRP